MFCPNCGNNCGDANFCSNCGAKLNARISSPINLSKKAAPKSIYQVNVNGHEINLLKVVGEYGANTPSVYAYLRREYGISKERAMELLAPFEAQVVANKPSHKNIFFEAANELAEKNMAEAKRKKELEESGQVYCPKCLSTSISANKKGFGIGKAVVGATVFGGIGLTAGNLGSKKVICTCLKCGYQWKPGKK